MGYGLGLGLGRGRGARASTWLRPRMPPPSMHRMFTGSASGENGGTCGATVSGYVRRSRLVRVRTVVRTQAALRLRCVRHSCGVNTGRHRVHRGRVPRLRAELAEHEGDAPAHAADEPVVAGRGRSASPQAGGWSHPIGRSLGLVCHSGVIAADDPDFSSL